MRFIIDFTILLFFENKRKRERNFAVGPLERFGRLHTSPWPEFREGAAFAGRNPAALVPDGEGEVGEEIEGSIPTGLWARLGAWMAGGWSTAEQVLQRWVRACSGELWWPGLSGKGLGRFNGRWRS